MHNLPDIFTDADASAVARKKDHIELAFRSQVAAAVCDPRFWYEPILSAHPTHAPAPFQCFGKTVQQPLWVSSMTGGTAKAGHINRNLARAAQEFGFGMGLGSCRGLLTDDAYLADFAVRPILGDALPLYANLGIAQLEKLLFSKKTDLIRRLLDKLQADGLIIHVNPLQEWLQPEGDYFTQSPLTTIQQLMEVLPEVSFIVKEVGQGMGYESLKALLKLPLAGLDFAAHGGTNFAQLELLRSDTQKQHLYAPLAQVGHTAVDMVSLVNQLVIELGDELRCQQLIISGGIQTFLDGYYLINKVSLPAIYGQASVFLKYAQADYETLQAFVHSQIRGLEVAKAFLKVR